MFPTRLRSTIRQSQPFQRLRLLSLLRLCFFVCVRPRPLLLVLPGLWIVEVVATVVLLLVVVVVVVVELVIVHPRLLYYFPHATHILSAVLLVQPGGLGVCGGAGVWVTEQRLDRREDRTDIVDWGPLILHEAKKRSVRVGASKLSSGLGAIQMYEDGKRDTQRHREREREGKREGGKAHLQNVQADQAIVVDVGVEHLREEPHGGRLVGILLRELHRQLESATFPWRFLWAEDEGLPQQDVLIGGAPRDALGRIRLQSPKVAQQAPPSRATHAFGGFS
mmetsp:Transcript_16786/g.63876  ORF Transcript_16786/g.63876 Transcript_16786/m.63876 type:complete len:279 (+) Transcript_16786:481-1317(+)